MRRVQEYWGEIKTFVDAGMGEWGIFVILVLVGGISFGLGRLSALEEVRPPVRVFMGGQVASPSGMHMGGLIVAAKGGSAYYFPWCAGAEKISAANRVWFKSEAEAGAAGYRAAKNCKGLDD